MKTKWEKQVPKNMDHPREYYFRGLSPLDIDNLKCGLITRQAMGQARERIKGNAFNIYHADMLLADELNAMLEAAK